MEKVSIASICYLSITVFSILFVLAINAEGYFRKLWLSALIKKQASKSNQTILIANLRGLYKPDKSNYLFLLAPLFTATMVFAIPFVGESASHLYMVISLFLAVYLIGCVVAVSHIVAEATRVGVDLRLENFVSEKEFDFLLKHTDKATKFDVNTLNRTVLAPEELIPFFLKKRELNVFIGMQENMMAVHEGKTDYLTTEQTKRNEQVLREFKKTIQPLDGLLKNIERAISENYRPKTKKEKQDIVETVVVNGRFDTVHREVEETLMQMNKDVTFNHEQKISYVPLPIQELERIAQSNEVSTQVKAQAKELLNRIKEKESKEKAEQEKEGVELDALAVIQASKQYFNIPDEEGRESNN